jgi:hypothetical protein
MSGAHRQAGSEDRNGDQAVSRYESREELADKARWEGGPADLVFGYGPDDLPGGAPPDVVTAAIRPAV